MKKMGGGNIKRSRELMAQFRAAHVKGMKALRDENWKVLDIALHSERGIVAAHQKLIRDWQTRILGATVVRSQRKR
jgi:hypothetical protein